MSISQMSLARISKLSDISTGICYEIRKLNVLLSQLMSFPNNSFYEQQLTQIRQLIMKKFALLEMIDDIRAEQFDVSEEDMEL